VAGRNQAAVVKVLGISKGTLSMWEGGSRRPSFDQLVTLDACYGAGGALVDLALALGTPAGLPARHTWAHNPQGPSRPHWAWLRPPPGSGRVEAHLRWAAFGLGVAEPCGDNGVFVTSPVSMPNPAVWVRLARPGWVDFGRGEIPDGLGVPVVSALAAAEVAGGGHSAAGLVAPHIVDRFTGDPAFARAVLRFFGDRDALVRQVFSTRPGGDRVTWVTAHPPEAPEARPHLGAAPPPPSPPPVPVDLRRLRQARALSQADAAGLVTRLLPDHPVSGDQIRGAENGGRPRTRLLRSRLDCVYRADGHSGTEAVGVREVGRAVRTEARFEVDFPWFWIGPVWVTFAPRGRSTGGRVGLEWAGDVKPMVVDCEATVTCRRAAHDVGALSVRCPAGWQVTAGTGHRPDARDVNFGWRHEGEPEAPPDVLDDVNEVFLHWFGRTRPELRDLLQRFSVTIPAP
jgi:hypothetical protein